MEIVNKKKEFKRKTMLNKESLKVKNKVNIASVTKSRMSSKNLNY